MHAEVTASESPTVRPDSERLDAVLRKILPFAYTADALARRSVGKIRTLAALSLLAAVWIGYASARTFDWQPATFFALCLPAVLPGVLLWKIHSTMRATIGLPQRIIDAASRITAKAIEYRQYHENRDESNGRSARPRFRQLGYAGKALLEIKALGDEAGEIATLAGGAIAVANPVFAMVLACSTVAALALIGVAGIVGLAYIL